MPQPKDKGWLNGYKNNRPIYALYKRPTSNLQTKSERLEKVFHTIGDQNKARVAILISDKINFKIKGMKRDKEGHYLMIK